MMAPLGDALLELAESSRHEFVMCAPFAKVAVVDRVLSVVKADVRVAMYTRWRPEEVAAGVSDTGVLQLLRKHGGVVYLHDRLHAKYYRNEAEALLGSANLTATALGWSPNSNLELLVRSDPDRLSALERVLCNESIEATAELANEVDRVASLLAKDKVPSIEFTDQIASTNCWVPQLRLPADLYIAYKGGADALTERSRAAAAFDLAYLDVPVGLDAEQFGAVVGHRLSGHPVFQRLDHMLSQPRRFGEMRRWVGELLSLDRYEADAAWQTIIRWLLEFQSHRYSHEVRRHSEVITRKGAVTEPGE